MNIGITNFKHLQEMYPAVSITKISEPILKYYNEKGLKEKIKSVWVDQIKDELILERIEDEEENDDTKEIDEDYSRDSEEIRSEFIELISGKDKKWGKATELLAEYIQQKLKMYTTKDDNRSEVWVFREGVYTPNGRSEVKELLRQTLRDFYSSFVYNKVIEKIEPDTFIDQEKFFTVNYREEIPVGNGILNILDKKLLPFDDNKVFFNKLPIKYLPNTECPKIKEFLKSTLKEEDDIKVFFELAGFSLLKEYRFEKAFMMVGNGRNGKGKSLELLKRLVGVKNCSSVPLISLDPDSFHISELFGKMLNLAGDIGNKDLKDTSMFKGLTGRDLINAHRKFQNDISFENYAKFVFACNELPMVYDVSLGFWSRWVLMEFPYTFVGLEEYNQAEDKTNLKVRDETIIEKITTSEEMSGFLNEALKGLDRLLLNKDFSSSKGTEETKLTWIRKSNSFMAFCYDFLESNTESKISKKELRQKYSEYCLNHKINTKSDYVIKRTLQDTFGVVDNYSEFMGIKENIWEGIKWKN